MVGKTSFILSCSLGKGLSLGYDAGFEQALLNQRVDFGATWFHNNIENLVTINNTAARFSQS
jgi:vitamin B12 transporter